MSQPISLALIFRQASFSLKELLVKMQESFAAWEAKQDLLKSWPETMAKYKESVRGMPKAFRHHPLVKKSLKEIESFEIEFRQFREKIKEYSLPDFQKWCEGLHVKARRAAELVAELESSPLAQKILRGETVLSNKGIVQWRRKLTHVTMGLSFLYLFVYSGWPESVIVGITSVFLMFSFTLETARHLNRRINQWVISVFGSIMREGENEKINAAIFYILSIGFVYLVFPLEVTILTLLFLAVGDPIAGVVGSCWGRRRISAHVSWEGAIACFLACSVLAALAAGVLFPETISGFPLIGFSLLGGVTGAVAEASFKRLDDNLVMPLLSAPVLWVLMKIFSIL